MSFLRHIHSRNHVEYVDEISNTSGIRDIWHELDNFRLWRQGKAPSVGSVTSASFFNPESERLVREPRWDPRLKIPSTLTSGRCDIFNFRKEWDFIILINWANLGSIRLYWVSVLLKESG